MNKVMKRTVDEETKRIEELARIEREEKDIKDRNARYADEYKDSPFQCGFCGKGFEKLRQCTAHESAHKREYRSSK